MSDFIAYDSEEELRENLAEIDEFLADLKITDKTLQEQRAELKKETRLTTEKLEQKVYDLEQRRDHLEKRQAELDVLQKSVQTNREHLQMQADAKRDARLGKSSKETPAKSADQLTSTGKEEFNTSISPQPVTKADVEKLKSQNDKPKIELTYDPPGGMGQASRVDDDFEKMVDARQKQGRLNDASIDMRANWNKSSGLKR